MPHHRLSPGLLLAGVIFLAGPRETTLAQGFETGALASQSTRTGPLGPGHAAPELFIQRWLTEPPAAVLSPGRVCVVEFWASWCPASRRAVGVLTRAQRRFEGDVTVVAVATIDGRDETTAALERFMHSQGPAMGYAVGLDDHRRTVRAWMDAAEQNLIPTAFIVDRSGKIAWIGNPIWPPGEFEDTLGQVVAGTFGPDERSATHKRWIDHREQVSALEHEVEQAEVNGKTDQASRVLEALMEMNPAGAGVYALRKFDILLRAGKDPSAAYAFARLAVGGMLADDPEGLNELAWTILEDERLSGSTPDGRARRDLDLAHQAASRAVELSGGRDAAILDTLARAWREKGDLDRAVETQGRAVEAALDSEERDEYGRRLAEYREQQARRRER